MSAPRGMLFAYIAGTGGGGVQHEVTHSQSVLVPVMSAPRGMLFAYIAGTGGGGVLLSPHMPQLVLLPL